MLGFFWILGAVGVAYGAKISGRNAFAWFVIAMAITPLLGSAALMTANRHGWGAETPASRAARKGRGR